ncbi:MAG: VOC family protein [Gammaproteobacteria bacterium]|nr:VOC family protein [Gammaproteobacteria bacterium]
MSNSEAGAPDILINVDVRDLEAGIAFYTNALGLRVGRRFGDVGAELLGGTSSVYLLSKEEGSAAYRRDGAPRRSYSRHWTPVHLDFVTDDLEASVERACSAGATLEQPLSDHAWGRMAVLADPFGNGFCILQFNERGYDALL